MKIHPLSRYRVSKIDIDGFLNKNIKVGHWFEGYFPVSPKIGLPMVVNQDVVNGVSKKSCLVSSPINKIEDNLIYTDHSVYQLEPCQ